jgi:hypothetical protein
VEGGQCRRQGAVLAVSVAAHLAIFAVLALQHPTLKARDYAPSVVQVAVIPFYLAQPRAKSRTEPAPPLHTRRPKDIGEVASVAPLYVPPARGPSDAGAQAETRGQDHPADHPPSSNAELGRILRSGGVHCDAEGMPGLTQADRDRCAELLGAGSKTAAPLARPVSREKQDQLDHEARHREACKAYHDYIYAPMPSLRDGAC